jgi:micrococcal nuclease
MTPYTYPCKVLRVIDADTLDIELDLGFHIKMQERVRLAAVNAPETYGANASEAGKAATAFVEAWVADRTSGGHLLYQSTRYNARDKYGRSLGFITWIDVAGGIEDLNVTLIKAGHAVPA